MTEDERKTMMILADTIKGEINRMCVTTELVELDTMYGYAKENLEKLLKMIRDAMYCQVYPRKDLNLIKVANGKPEWCPIKCDIEDIKAEIDSHCSENRDRNDGLYIAMKIIDKHIKGESE